jgi:asparagine synthase (glutamine-hydrolysing)
VSRDADGRYLDSLAFFQPDEKRALYSSDVRRSLAEWNAEEALSARLARFTSLPANSRMMRLDFETYLPEDVLTKVDRMSMAHSIESRVPLLDNSVIDFAARPVGAQDQQRPGKRIPKRQSARCCRTESSIEKTGFGVPLGVWFRGGLADVFSDVLLSARTRQRGYFEAGFVDRLVQEHLSGRRDHTLRLWQLLVLELWQRRYLDAAPAVAARAAG